MPAEEIKRRARCSAETINGLVRISDREDVSVVPRQSRQNLDLREVSVLKFVDQNEAGAGALLFQALFRQSSVTRGPA